MIGVNKKKMSIMSSNKNDPDQITIYHINSYKINK